MKYAIFIIGLLTSFSALSESSFEYHGIKSGMSREAVNGLVGCTERCYSLDYKGVEAFLGEEGPPRLWQIGFRYTSDNKLWKLQLNFLEVSSGPAAVAQRRALTELYPDVELDTLTESGSYGNTDYIVAQLIDRALFDADAETIYQSEISKY
jgi:hypothetical protein